jgi:hypothetical protein
MARTFPGPARTILGRTHYLYFLANLALFGMGFIIWIAGDPSWYRLWCLEKYLPTAQDRFGFRVKRVHIPGFGWGSDPLAVVEASPGGVLERAGFRPGDVPVEYHGGESAFCGALQEAEDGGDYRKVDVINLDDWDRRAKRELEIPRVPARIRRAGPD